MKIKPIKLVEPTKAQKEIFEEYFTKHNKGLKAIKTLEEIKVLVTAIRFNTQSLLNWDNPFYSDFVRKTARTNNKFIGQILKKINEVENG